MSNDQVNEFHGTIHGSICPPVLCEHCGSDHRQVAPSIVCLHRQVESLQEENTELRARLHRIGDDRLEESVKHCTMGSENRELKEQLQELQVRIAELEGELEKHRWIPVDERLPKHNCSILARGKDGYGYEICAVISYNLEFNKFRVLTDVTHWKQIYLPLPKKEGKS